MYYKLFEVEFSNGMSIIEFAKTRQDIRKKYSGVYRIFRIIIN